MDTSPEYVKMCEEAEEIQELRPDEWGDFLYFKDDEEYRTVCCIRHCSMNIGYYDIDNSIWLPRQDQLQGMVKIKNVDSQIKLIIYFYVWLKHFSKINPEKEKYSMEQLWLAFVMYEKYQKHWNGTTWTDTIKTESNSP